MASSVPPAPPSPSSSSRSPSGARARQALACGVLVSVPLAGLALVLASACGGGSGSGNGGGGTIFTPPVQTGPGCGYEGKGSSLHVADGLDVCLPPVVCTSETCPPPLGKCEGGACKFTNGYAGLATLGEAWVTYYCTLSTQGCHGVTQLEYPEVTAAEVGKNLGYPLCEADPSAPTCVGIAASSPMLVGNSQVATDPATGSTVATWGLGMTEASGLCYELTGPGGKAIVALTDRCGGYCKCGGSDFQECGPCVSAADMEPNCPCVGTAPSRYTNCCGADCGGAVTPTCDWCANNNHPHFDLDTGTFDKLCAASKVRGSCKLTNVAPVPCLAPGAWPPAGTGGACKANSFQCQAAAAGQPQVPGTKCCCNYGKTPQPDGTCA